VFCLIAALVLVLNSDELNEIDLKVKEALEKGQCAWELLCRLREVIENGKACKYTSCNPLLITAEEALMCAERELLNAKSKMDCINSESRLVEQYRNVVEDFRRDLKVIFKHVQSSSAQRYL